MAKPIAGSEAKKRKYPKLLYIMPPLLILAAFALFCAFAGRGAGPNGDKAAASVNSARICFLDVGQGDSATVVGRDACVLIDTGDSSYSNALTDRLNKSGIKAIDALIGTHPHGDHIGGFEAVVTSFDIGRVYMPRVTNNTRAFEQALKCVAAKKMKINAPSPGDVLELSGGVAITFLGPVMEDEAEINNSSIIIRVEMEASNPFYVTERGGDGSGGNDGGGGRHPLKVRNDGVLSVLFMADAEHGAERLLIDSGADIRADILKIGHHGSATSTSAELLSAVAPSCAIIQCGEGNPYGHPDPAVLEMLADKNITVLRSDIHGAVTFYTD